MCLVPKQAIPASADHGQAAMTGELRYRIDEGTASCPNCSNRTGNPMKCTCWRLCDINDVPCNVNGLKFAQMCMQKNRTIRTRDCSIDPTPNH